MDNKWPKFNVLYSVLFSSYIGSFDCLLDYLRLVPAFEKNLQKLSNQSKSKLIKRRGWKEWLLSCICRSKEERAFYRFTTLMMKHERDFKLKVYPSLGFSFIIPFIFIFTTMNNRGFNQAGSKSYLTIYFSMLIIPTVVMMLRYSGKYKGAWILKHCQLRIIRYYLKVR